MSRCTPFRTGRLVAGSLLTLLGVSAPLATGHAQSVSPDRALLNSASIAYPGVLIGSKRTAPTTDGDRALLGRSSPDDSATLVLATRSAARGRIVTGDLALLGRAGPTDRRRVVLAW